MGRMAQMDNLGIPDSHHIMEVGHILHGLLLQVRLEALGLRSGLVRPYLLAPDSTCPLVPARGCPLPVLASICLHAPLAPDSRCSPADSALARL